MPTYGEGKTRTLVRSILPSKYRKRSRFTRRNVHRRARHADNQSIRSWLGDWDDYPGVMTTARAAHRRSTEDELIDEMKWERRLGDKDSAIMRWGPEQVRNVRREDKLSKLRSVFPNDLPGRHALTHLRYAEEIRRPEDDWFRVYRVESEERLERAAAADAEFRGHLLDLIENGGLGHFNQRVRHVYEVRVPPAVPFGRPTRRLVDFRPLCGVHDLDPYIAYLRGTRLEVVVKEVLSLA